MTQEEKWDENDWRVVNGNKMRLRDWERKRQEEKAYIIKVTKEWKVNNRAGGWTEVFLR